MISTSVTIEEDLDTGHRFVRLRLASTKKRRGGIPASSRDIQMFGKTEKEFDYEFRVSAGSLAEHRSLVDKVNIDPDEVIRHALESLDEALLDLAQKMDAGAMVDKGVINP